MRPTARFNSDGYLDLSVFDQLRILGASVYGGVSGGEYFGVETPGFGIGKSLGPVYSHRGLMIDERESITLAQRSFELEVEEAHLGVGEFHRLIGTVAFCPGTHPIRWHCQRVCEKLAWLKAANKLCACSDGDERLRSVHQVFVVFGQPPMAAKPTKSSLDDPVKPGNSECLLFAFHDDQSPVIGLT